MHGKFYKIDYVKSFAVKNDDVALALREEPMAIGDILDVNVNSNANALKAILEQILEDKNWSRKTTMSSLIQKFSKAPYGYRPIDIRVMVASMLVNNKVKCLMFDQVQNIKEQNFIVEYSKGSQDEKIIIEPQGTIDQSVIMDVRRIMKDSFDITIEPKEATLRDESVAYFKNKMNQLENIKRNNDGDYPGKKIVEEALPVFVTVTSSNDAETIFQRIKDNEDKLYEIGGKLDSVINFHNASGTQMKTWREAQELVRYYDDNRMFISGLQVMEEPVQYMGEILAMPEPFSSISRLSQLVVQVKGIRDDINTEIVNDAKRSIEVSLEEIKKEADAALKMDFNKAETEDEIKNLLSDEESVFDSLFGFLTDANKCANAKDKAHSEVRSFKRALADIIAKDKGNDTPNLKIKSVSAVDLIPVASRTIKTPSDIDNAVESFRESLEKLLSDNDEVDIR